MRRIVSTSRSRSPPTDSLHAAVAGADTLGAARHLCKIYDSVYVRLDASPLAKNKSNGVSVHRVVGLRPGMVDATLPFALRGLSREALRAADRGGRPPSLQIKTRAGPRRLVVKVFPNLSRLERWVLMTPSMSRLEFVGSHDTRTEANVFREAAAVYGVPVERARRRLVAKRIACFVNDIELLGDEFLVESLISMAVNRLRRHCPHLLGYEDAFVHGPTGRAFILMHRADATLASYFASLPAMPPEQVVTTLNVVAFQVAAALHTLQTHLRLKHHDLHGSNVFVTSIRRTCVVGGKSLYNAQVLRYDLGGRTYYLPNIGITIMLADFGMASMTLGGRRVGRIDMGDFDGRPDWGPWNNELDGAEGYDLQVFIGFLSMCGLGGSPHVAATHGAYLSRFLGAPPLTKQGRPTSAASVSRVCPLAFIEAAFSGHGPARPVYDFTAFPSGLGYGVDDPAVVSMM